MRPAPLKALPRSLRHVRILQAARPGVGPTFSFVGRISGVVVSLLIVRLVGAGPRTAPIFLAIALATFAINSLGSILELQAIASLSRGDASRSSILFGGTALGVVLAAVVTLGVLVASTLNGTAANLKTPALMLMPTIPMASYYFVRLGIDIFDARWARPAWASSARTLVVAGALLMSLPHWGPAAVAPSMLAAEGVRVLALRPWKPHGGTVDFRHVRNFAQRVLVQLPSTMFGAANPIVDRYVTHGLRVGSVAILDLAEKSQGFVYLTLTQGVLPVLYRRWSLQDTSEQSKQIRRVAWAGLAVGMGFAVVGTLVIYIATPYVLGARAAGYIHVMRVASAIYLIGIPAYIGSQVLVRLLLLQDKRLAWFSVIALNQLIINVALDLFLGPRFGLPGIAAASAIVCWVTFYCYVMLTRGRPLHSQLPSRAS